jgi:penicillin-binding protein 2
MFGYVYQIWRLQIEKGEEFFERSANNRLRYILVFAERGIIYDRNGKALAWNNPKENQEDFSKRVYTDESGFSNLLGYVKYPQKDSSGFYYSEEFTGFNGIEKYYNNLISGINGLKIIETDATENIVEDNTIKNPVNGKRLDLTIDSELQSELFNTIKNTAEEVGFQSGAGIIMDVNNGEVHALVSYPEFDSNVLTSGENEELIDKFLNDPSNSFLNRATKGLYTPGSIIKPYVALAALNENIVSPTKKIVSEGKLFVPNPYDPENPSVFSDWKAHGPVDVKEAIAYSSNIYFYQVGGGYEPNNQIGLGISRLEGYLKYFGFGRTIMDEPVLEGSAGTIPNPEWKAENFDGDIWRLGDTYFTSIGQYGLQVTPIQVARAVSSIANDGKLIEPRIVKDSPVIISKDINSIIDQKYFEIVKEGMREGVLFGTAKGLDIPKIEIAAKTGTAELGETKAKVNSWVTGFFPYKNPKYSFVVVLEKGNRTNLIGGVYVMRQVFEWMINNKPEYFN